MSNYIAILLDELKYTQKEGEAITFEGSTLTKLISEIERLKQVNTELVDYLRYAVDFIEDMSFTHNFNDCGKVDKIRAIVSKHEVKDG